MVISRWWNKARDAAANGLRAKDDEMAEVIAELTPHDARRRFTLWLNWNSCPRDIISALRGDADGDMVALYTEYGEDTIKEEYESAMPSIGV